MCSVQEILRDLAPCNTVLFAKMKFKFKGSSGHDRNASVWVRERPLTERCKVVSHAGSKAAQQEEMMFLSQGFGLFVFSLHEKTHTQACNVCRLLCTCISTCSLYDYQSSLAASENPVKHWLLDKTLTITSVIQF